MTEEIKDLAPIKPEEPKTNSPEAHEEQKMPFMSHLSELRTRIMICLGSIMVCFCVTFTYSEELFNFMLLPLKKDLVFQLTRPFLHFIDRPGAVVSLVFLEPAEAFWMQLKVAMIAGVIISIPIILMQLWLFIAPGLKQAERKYLLPFIIAGTGLFSMGATFCFLVILPFALSFLLTYKTASLTPMLSVGHYVDFILKFVLAFGIVFELPIVLLLLTRLGVITPKKLAQNRKYAIVIAFIAAGILTPTPDAFNQTLMAVPIIMLYEIGIIASRIFYVEKKTV
ncbi:MAG: twin-arginine translocase subunit TatC [Nitrospirae bacterium]|nr:twin-arginine translocase subunit TatC [Nitrospirota bacterium]MBF0542214.1 twin-arginine translocase subunit TatC [Nitrospirota bacterium]